MKHLCASAALLAMISAAVPALAEDTAQSTVNGQLDTGTTASTGAAADFGTVIDALKTSKNSANAIQSLAAVGKVEVVKLADVVGPDELRQIDQAAQDNEPDITGLQAAIMANPALKSAVDAESVDTSNIVAAHIEADGSVTVFVK